MSTHNAAWILLKPDTRMPVELSDQDLKPLRLEYLADAREKIELLKNHAESLGARKQFKTSFPVLLFLSHQLKGSGGSLGFGRISELAQSISRELNGFLEAENEERQSPAELSKFVLAAANDLAKIVTTAEAELNRIH